jgi:hypothetical protein
MPRAQFCPLGYNNLLCDLPFDVCRNYSFCQLQTIAWELPYEFSDEGFLIVKDSGAAFGLTLPTGKFSERHFFDLTNLITAAWLEYGWAAAEPFPFDPIPF